MWKQSTMLKAGVLPRGTRSTLLLPRGAFPTTTRNTNDETSYYIITTKMVNFPVKEVCTRSTKKQHDGVPTFKVRKDVMMLPFVQNGRIMSAEDDIQSSSVQPYQPFTTI
jgi:hypothetical protein